MSNDGVTAASGARKKRQSTFGRGLRREYVPLWVPSLVPTTSAKKKKTLGSGRREAQAANGSRQVSNAVAANASSSTHSVHRRLFDKNEPSTSSTTSLTSTCKKVPGRPSPNISVSKIRRNIALKSSIPKIMLTKPQNTLGQMVSKPTSSSESKSQTAEKKPSIPHIMSEDKSDNMKLVNQEALLSDELISPQTAVVEEIRKMSSIFASATEKQNIVLSEITKGIERQNNILSALMKLLKKKFVIEADQQIHSDNDSEDECLDSFEEEENKTLAHTLISDSVVHDEKVSNPAHSQSEQEVRPKCRKSIVMYNSMRSQVTCLKTPLGKSTIASAVPVTPKSIISRRVQTQLEELFDSDSSK